MFTRLLIIVFFHLSSSIIKINDISNLIYDFATNINITFIIETQIIWRNGLTFKKFTHNIYKNRFHMNNIDVNIYTHKKKKSIRVFYLNSLVRVETFKYIFISK